MSLRPTAIAISKVGYPSMYVVIDDPDTNGPLLIPCSFDHRRIDVTREELVADYELHQARAASPNKREVASG